MKTIKYMAIMLLITLGMISCSDDDSPRITGTVSPTLNALSSDKLMVYSTNNIYTFTWTEARFFLDGNEQSTPIGVYEDGGISYDLQVDLAGGSFENEVSAGIKVSDLYMDVNASELLDIVKSAFGIADDAESVDLSFRLVARYGSTSQYSLISTNVLSATLDMTVSEGTEIPGDGEDDGYEEDFNDGLMHKIYVNDQTGWTDLSLYAWNETGNMLSWPGVHYSSEVTIAGTTWKVFDMPSDYQHREDLNYIFNDNGQGNQFDAMTGFTFNHDLFITINPDLTYTFSAGPVLSEDGFTVYANIDDAGWGGVYMYAWNENGDFESPWPGAQGEGPIEINSKQWYYHTFNSTSDINVIVNDNSGNQTSDITGHRDIYVTVHADNTYDKTSGLYK